MAFLTVEVILITLLMFFVLVGIHEWGHFFFAKRAGILVREFAIGFGPKAFSYKKGETLYTFRLLPFGGYVRMAGEDPEVIQINKSQTIAVGIEDQVVTKLFLDQLDQRSHVIRGVVEEIDLEDKLKVVLDVDGELQSLPVHREAMIIARGKETQIAPLDRQFSHKSVGKRAMTLFAGPMMNAVLAVVLFFSLMYMVGVPVENPTYLLVGHVEQESPADQAGLQTKDIVVSVDGEQVGANTQMLISKIEDSPEQPMQWSIIRDNQSIMLTVTPQEVEGVGRVGIGIALPTKTPNIGEALSATWSQTIHSGQLIIDGLRMLVTLQLGWDDLGGPVRIVEFTGEAATHGFSTLVSWTAVLSLYFAIFNLLPFPALDGSRLLFIGLEALRGKPIDPNREGLVHFIGFAMLMVLMVIVTYNDILRLFKG